MSPITTHQDRRQHPRLRSLLVLLLVIALMPVVAIVEAGPAGAATTRPSLASVRAALASRGIRLGTGAGGGDGSGVDVRARSAAPSPAATPAPAPTTSTTAPSHGTNSPATTAPSDPAATSTPARSGRTTDHAAGSAAGTTTGNWSISASVRAFLAGLGLSFAAGALTGSLTGSTLTVAVGTPTLPVQLPGGDPVSLTGASLTINKSTGVLTLTATVDAGNGIGGSVSIMISHSSNANLTGAGRADLSSTVTVTGLPLLGSAVDVTGSLADTGGTVSATLTGTLDADLTVAPDALTVAEGTTLTLSTTDGLSLTGTALAGLGGSAVTVDVSGTVTGPKDFSLTVDDATDTPSFTPVSGLTLTPSFTGTISDAAGSVGFDISADDLASWTPATGVTLAVKHVEVSNSTPGSGLTCPSSYQDGDVWVDVTGRVSDSASGVSATGGACIDLTAQSFTVSAAEHGSFRQSTLGFGLSGAALSVTGDLKAGTVSASVRARLTLSGVAGSPAIPITLTFASDGSFVGAASVNLSRLGLGSGTGKLLLSSEQIKNYTNKAIGVTRAITLPAGVTVLLRYKPNNQVDQLFKLLNLTPRTSIQAQATLSTTGFSIALTVSFGSGSHGIAVLPNAPGGFQIYLDSLHLKVAIGESGGSITIGGTALLHIPALYSGSSASEVDLSLNGSLVLSDDSVKINAGFDLDAPHGWTDAFGIPGLSIGELAANIGVEEQPEDAGIPLPTLSFTVNNVVLPDTWANVIGELPGAAVSATLDLDADNPILSFAIAPGPGQSAALEPLRIANDFAAAGNAAPLPDSVVGALQLQDASLLFAPTGGMDATGASVAPGASLVFDAVIGGQFVHVDGSVGLAPYPHLTAHVSVPSFGIGPISFAGTKLDIDLEADPAAPKIDFDFAGGFTDSFTGTQFSANIDLGASLSAVNASVALTIAAGQPTYIAAGAQLNGSVYLNSSGFGFSVSGSADAYVAGQYIGTVPVSYSSDSGALFQKLQELGNQIAAWFRDVYGETDTQVTAVLNQIGDSAAQIASVLQSAFGDSQAAVYNALEQIGDGGQTVLDAISGFFNTGSYWIYSNPWYSVPLYLDNSGGSYAPGNGIIQYTWTGGHNQDWYVLPTDSGYAEIVNRQSGQCLSAFGNAGDQVAQYPCYGAYQQQWYLGIYPGQNLNYTGHNVTNRASGLDLDVNQASTSAGAAIDTWYGNGDWNQWFTFEPAIG